MAITRPILPSPPQVPMSDDPAELRKWAMQVSDWSRSLVASINSFTANVQNDINVLNNAVFP